MAQVSRGRILNKEFAKGKEFMREGLFPSKFSASG